MQLLELYPSASRLISSPQVPYTLSNDHSLNYTQADMFLRVNFAALLGARQLNYGVALEADLTPLLGFSVDLLMLMRVIFN